MKSASKRLSLFAVAVLAACTGCSSSSKDHHVTREAVAKATQRLKPEIQWSAEKLGQAARWAAEEAIAAAEGFYEGWNREQAPVDLNSASLRQLESLPGISRQDAREIIDNRPYRRPDELVDKGVLPRAAFRRIRDQVEVRS